MTTLKQHKNMAKLEANQIPWQKLAEWGIQQRVLEANQEAMQRLIAGRYTPPMNFYRKDDGLSVEGQAAIRCYKAKDGSVKLELQGVGEPITENSKLYLFGVELTREQVKNLADTGHAGSLVPSKDGSKQYFVSLNKETNRLVSMPAESVTGPKDSMIAGVRLDQNQMEKYLNGEAVYLKGMKRSDGQTFDACVQFSAWTRKNDFTHPEWLKEALKAEKEALKKMESLGEKQGEDTGKKKGRSH